MSRPLLILIVAVVAVVAALFLLSGRATEREQVQVEKAVALENLAN